MDDFDKKLELSLNDLKRVQRRIQMMEATYDRSMSYMERAADNCWEYPGADEKYAELSEKMIKLEEKQNILSEASSFLTKVVENLSRLS